MKIGGAVISGAGLVAGITTFLGVRASLRVDLVVLCALAAAVVYCVLVVSIRRRANRRDHRADLVAAGLAAALTGIYWFELSSPTANGWPRTSTSAAAAIILLLIVAWTSRFTGAPRPSIELFKNIPFPLAESTALAFMVCMLTISVPLQLITTAVDVGTNGGHTVRGTASTGNGSTANGPTGNGSTGNGSTGNGSTGNGSTGNGSTGNGSAPPNPCGDSAPFGANSRSPDLEESFYELIQADNGPGENVAGCPRLVHHLVDDPGVEYEFGFDSAGEKASLAIVSPKTRAVFLYPAVAVALRLMKRFGAIDTSGAQCAGNGSWVLIYDSQGTEALIRANINDHFTDLAPPAFYAFLAAMKDHDEEWLWPIRRPSPYPGIERFDLVHDTVTNDVVDTVYYDTRAARAYRVVDGATIYYNNVPGTTTSPSLLESLSPKNENCSGLRATSNLPVIP